MIREYINIIFIVVFFSLLATSCRSQSYYKKVKDNIEDFSVAIDRLDKKLMLHQYDSISLSNAQSIKLLSKCIYREQINDTLICKFMRKYDLTRICLKKYNKEFYDSAINFNKDHIPFFGKSIIITYDFGKSQLRDLANHGKQLKDEKIFIINDKYLYRVRSKPSFGE
jgi:hypothetical protein